MSLTKPMTDILASIKRKFSISNVLMKCRNLLHKKHPLQKTKPRKGFKYIKLGSQYGGWTFIHTQDLYSSTIVSAGLGEDASFDIEFANRYSANVVIVDPTPRAIEHFKEILAHSGEPASTPYVDGGKQPISAYELAHIHTDRLILVDKALWNEAKILRFYLPKNQAHVSHSISNIGNDYRNDTDHIEVQSITLPILLSSLSIPSEEIPLIKLDIEGAEIEVVTHFISEGILPLQILVELDDLAKPGRYAFERIDRVNEVLMLSGYTCVHSDGARNFLFVLVDKLAAAGNNDDKCP